MSAAIIFSTFRHITKLQKNNPRVGISGAIYFHTKVHTLLCCSLLFFAHRADSLIFQTRAIIIYSCWILVSHEPLTPAAPAYKTLVLFHSLASAMHPSGGRRRAKANRECVLLLFEWNIDGAGIVDGAASSSFGHNKLWLPQRVPRFLRAAYQIKFAPDFLPSLNGYVANFLRPTCANKKDWLAIITNFEAEVNPDNEWL